MSYPVPMRNIYYLLCYAYDFLPEVEDVPRGIEDFNRPEDLLGGILAQGIAAQIRHRLDRNYLEREEELRGIRGKLNLSASLKTGRLQSGFAVCSYETLEVNILTNRLLKAAVRLLLLSPVLDPNVRHDLERIWYPLGDINDGGISVRDFRSIQIHRNNSSYRFLLNIAKMVFTSSVADENAGEGCFTDFREDEARMGELFESFVFNYYRKHLAPYIIIKPEIKWQGVEASTHDRKYLPVMRTDLVAHGKPPNTRSIVADMKYYRSMLTYRFDVGKLRSSHMFQLTTYLRNIRLQYPHRVWEGILIYAVSKQKVHLDYSIDGIRVKIRTLDLSCEWHEVESELVSIMESRVSSLSKPL